MFVCNYYCQRMSIYVVGDTGALTIRLKFLCFVDNSMIYDLATAATHRNKSSGLIYATDVVEFICNQVQCTRLSKTRNPK
jgi:hypothetical protein